jgi:octaprenyl-diphosphate synthase
MISKLIEFDYTPRSAYSVGNRRILMRQYSYYLTNIIGNFVLAFPLQLKPELAAIAQGSEALDFGTAMDPILADLGELRQLLPRLIPQHSATSKEICSTYFEEGGKFFRPALFLLSCQLVGYSGVHKLPMAGVCELVHTASLLHDDVIDNSPRRRNKPTVNHLWGDESAVLVGDLFYATASELMAATEKLEIVRRFAQAIRTMSEGELLQLENIRHFEISAPTYFEILRGKTAALIGVICRAAGVLGELPEEKKQALEDFGLALGLAFQLVDDGLDYLGEKDALGKAPLTDVREGKVTLPLLLLKERATADEINSVAECLNQDVFGLADAEYIACLVEKYGTAKATLERAQEFTATAVATLQKHFRESSARRHLEKLAVGLLCRGY